MEVTGLGGRRSERQMSGTQACGRRKEVRTTEKEGETGSRGVVWSRRVAGMGREMEAAGEETPLFSHTFHLAGEFQVLD